MKGVCHKPLPIHSIAESCRTRGQQSAGKAMPGQQQVIQLASCTPAQPAPEMATLQVANLQTTVGNSRASGTGNCCDVEGVCSWFKFEQTCMLPKSAGALDLVASSGSTCPLKRMTIREKLHMPAVPRTAAKTYAAQAKVATVGNVPRGGRGRWLSLTKRQKCVSAIAAFTIWKQIVMYACINASLPLLGQWAAFVRRRSSRPGFERMYVFSEARLQSTLNLVPQCTH